MIEKIWEMFSLYANFENFTDRLQTRFDTIYTRRITNPVFKEIYAPFTDEEISAKIAEMITPENCPSEIAVVYQTIDHLHQACPNHSGDWYFSGDYPTPGGNRQVGGAFVEWYEKRFNS